MNTQDSQMAGTGPNQTTVSMSATLRDHLETLISGRTDAEILSEANMILRNASPEARQQLIIALAFSMLGRNESKQDIRDVHEHMDELNAQVLNTREFATKQAIDNTESHENYVKATDRLNEATNGVDNRCRKTEEQGSMALKVANMARDSFKYWDKSVQEELEEMFNRRVPIFEAYLREQFAIQAAGTTTADANMRELADRVGALENSLRQDLANQAQNVEAYVQREIAHVEQRVEEKFAKKMKEEKEAQDKKNKALEAKIEALMNMRG
ncbi:hypothetical protein K4K56_004011 [Colletotrichum sp. SAR 10_98]|nr:hypothetical protein K4K56_004011 [Colletotrichum sp. SAR 10_98]